MVLAKPTQVPEATRTETSWGACILSASCTAGQPGKPGARKAGSLLPEGWADSVAVLCGQGRCDRRITPPLTVLTYQHAQEGPGSTVEPFQGPWSAHSPHRAGAAPGAELVHADAPAPLGALAV